MKDNNQHSRREFIRNAAALGLAGTLGTNALLSSCSKKSHKELNLPPLLDRAPDGPVLKAGVIGCGYRGTGAALNFLNSGPNVEIVALGDVMADRLELCRQKLKEEKQVEIADEKCFVGFEAWEKVIDAGVDVVILATPPQFRPAHFEACIKALKHVFMEKPIAVDPVGVRSVMTTAHKAKAMGLSVVAGTIYRHQRDYIETYKKVAGNEIGEIVSANSYYNVGKLWHRKPKPEWSEMEAMIRDWVNWCWLSGDHIVEQHVHNLDVVNWFTGSHPIKATGFGGRHRRLTGNQYDFFSVDFVYENQVHYHSMCRQINDCSNNVSDQIRGTKGYTNCINTIFNHDGSVKWKYQYPLDENGKMTDRLKVSSFDQEHIDLVTAIRTNEPVNEAINIAESTLTGIMGRVSAYTGKEVTWEEILNSDLKLGPKVYAMGPVDVDKSIPVPGSGAE